MNHGETFCKLAYEALRDEEAELAELASNNKSARPLSVIAVAEASVSEKIRDLIPNPVFSTSPSIKLNRLEATDTKAQDKADLWKYLRVIVFTGAHVGSAQSAGAHVG